MTTVAIIAKSLCSLMVDVEMSGYQPINAYFAASGNELPYNMWISLTNSIYDMQQAQDEVERCNG